MGAERDVSTQTTADFLARLLVEVDAGIDHDAGQLYVEAEQVGAELHRPTRRTGGCGVDFLTATPDGQYGGPWAGGKVFWYVRPGYQGRVLIRGRRLNGPQRIGFNGQRLPERELRIERGMTVTWQGQPPGSRGVPSAVRVRSAGCYGVQIDGTGFSRTVVFKAVLAG